MKFKSIYDPHYRKLVATLVEARKNAGISQTQLAIELGLNSHSYISKIESCERNVTLLDYIRICRVLKFDPKGGIDILMKASSKMR
ncbi:helix-turn-helix domain-containing protein [Paraglaciecola hydrolytica]|uniref:HTH cro/C1-type domain-containing protein n=1 Tax=Paraglaciecola hydrolytica TaxID=1799789 RepID=A0A136A2G2_9ALTE|nr:hypothetical protein AX660_14870 [Paraglaciecola hydrolytica]